MSDLPRDLLLEMHRRMVRIRRFEEHVETMVERGEIVGSAHGSIGQEGEIVGACTALRDDDYMAGNHRSHGHPIGKGAPIDRLMAEMLGKVTGVNRGKGGSMHLADFSVGSIGETSIVATGIPIAVGAALAAKMRGDDRVALAFFGDGATNAGDFHEGVNLAAVWQLPVIFLCENNLYSVSTRTESVTSGAAIAKRAKAYGIRGVVVDGQDACKVHEVVRKAVARARAGEGPTIVEAMTYLYTGHSVGLPIAIDRPDGELDAWKARDPIAIHRRHLVKKQIATEAELDALEAAVDAELDAAVEFARRSEYPDESELYRNLFADPVNAEVNA